MTIGYKYQIIYDCLSFVTELTIAYIIYLSNGEKNNYIEKAKPLSMLAAAHKSVNLVEHNSSLVNGS